MTIRLLASEVRNGSATGAEHCEPDCDADAAGAQVSTSIIVTQPSCAPRNVSKLLDQLAGEPRTLDQLVLDTGRDLTELSVALLRFEHLGWVARSGSWYERIGP